MSQEGYVLVIWEEAGIPNIQGLYPDTPKTFKYLKKIVLEDLREWESEVKIPESIQNSFELSLWYSDQTQEFENFWRIDLIGPEEAPEC